jgi:hypothetical protein
LNPVLLIHFICGFSLRNNQWIGGKRTITSYHAFTATKSFPQPRCSSSRDIHQRHPLAIIDESDYKANAAPKSSVLVTLLLSMPYSSSINDYSIMNYRNSVTLEQEDCIFATRCIHQDSFSLSPAIFNIQMMQAGALIA